MKHIKTPVRYCYEDWMLFDADDQWLASFDAGEIGPEIAAALNAHDALVDLAELVIIMASSAPETVKHIGGIVYKAEKALALVHGEAADG